MINLSERKRLEALPSINNLIPTINFSRKLELRTTSERPRILSVGIGRDALQEYSSFRLAFRDYDGISFLGMDNDPEAVLKSRNEISGLGQVLLFDGTEIDEDFGDFDMVILRHPNCETLGGRDSWGKIFNNLKSVTHNGSLVVGTHFCFRGGVYLARGLEIPGFNIKYAGINPYSGLQIDKRSKLDKYLVVARK